MQHLVKTIKIENKDSDSGFSVINECDFKKDKHVEFKEKAPAKAKAKKAAAK